MSSLHVPYMCTNDLYYKLCLTEQCDSTMLSCPCHAAAPCCLASPVPWCSCMPPRLARMRAFEGGDLEAKGELDRAVKVRSWRGEIILTYANEAGTAWVANLMLGSEAPFQLSAARLSLCKQSSTRSNRHTPHRLAPQHNTTQRNAVCARPQPKHVHTHRHISPLHFLQPSDHPQHGRLRAVGIDHALAITLKPQHCKSLAGSTAKLSCGWSSWEMQNCATRNSQRTLWYVRHHYMVRLLASGGVNVMMLDGDVTAQVALISSSVLIR